MEGFNRYFGERVFKVRSQRSLTREELAEKAKISDRFVYDIETGKKGCSAEVLLSLARALNVSADYLITGNEPQTETELRDSVMILSSLPSASLPYLNTIIKAFAEYAKEAGKGTNQS